MLACTDCCKCFNNFLRLSSFPHSVHISVGHISVGASRVYTAVNTRFSPLLQTIFYLVHAVFVILLSGFPVLFLLALFGFY